MRRRLAMGTAVALALVLAACGSDGDDDASTEPAADTGGDRSPEAASAGDGGDFCTDLETVVTESAALMTALFGEDLDGVRTVVEGPLGEAGVAAEMSAPEALVDDVTVVNGWTRDLLGALEAVDLDDPAAIEGALAGVPATDEDVDAAGERLSDYATAECGFDPEEAMGEVGMPESPEPPDPCAFVDAAVAATPAGVELADSGGNDTASFDVGVYAIRGCAYDRGEMIVSTLTFAGSVDEIIDMYTSSTEDQGGTVTTDFDAGDLPASTLITTANGTSTITVFEAPSPFSVGFQSVTDPAPLVASAEAVLAATG